MEYAPVLTFDPVSFRAQIPPYADPTAYPDAILSGWFDIATNYISDLNYGFLNNGARQMALNLMAAHLIFLRNKIGTGAELGSTALTSSATIDKISVTSQLPPGDTQFRYWLNLSPFGQELLFLLTLKGTGGVYIGGRFELAAFRRPGGRCR